MNDQEKKGQRIYDLFNAETKLKILCLSKTKQINNSFFYRKRAFYGKGEWKIKQKSKRRLLTALAKAIKKDTTTSIRKLAWELKIQEKTVKTAIKQDLSPDLSHLHYVIWGILENKTNATSHANIGSLKTAIEEGWNEISEELILKECKSFRRRVDTII